MPKGKNAIVTGSTSGIGLGIASAFCEAGMNVMLNGFGDAEKIESVRAGLEADHGVTVRYNSADMSKPDQIRDLAEYAKAELGQVDVVVNNAGIQHVEIIEDFPDEKWDAIISINLTAAFHLIKHTVKDMKARKWGRIINLASAHGLVASPFKSAYVASKHGVIGLTKVVGLEYAEDGITCNAICPGWVKTGLVEQQIADQARTTGISEENVIRDVMLAGQPTKEFVTVEQLAATALFLCSDGAASITGTSISVDGGWTAR
ncbi:MAG: 3-hydroxybutyrate dehydrogenase [Hyphomicrobiaceae bacterium]|nr:3-hydroxybutyrate dehydrogenase [Hyphomicrobiaceae bacterium]